ncbi:hypothetical protein OE88DRAFT_1733786 [Heliocybe sulcata]|uniref:Uncharacterized protein n=1 Tax=Heliocybe sulcata TaxID=5364 RepID=A0A5C3N682_9AGAM|nr:hypothetical protein OE88DRAFT_1733786 [Heliocybe sulcata]
MLWPTTTKRNPVLISLCSSWWLSTFPCLLLLYFSGEVVGPPPRYSTCLASASLTIAQSALVATSATSLVFHIWLTMRDAVGPKPVPPLWYRDSLETILLVLMPYLAFVITGLTTLVLGFAHPSSVYRALFYCVVDIRALEVTVSAICLATLVLAGLFGFWTGVLLVRNCSSIVEQDLDQSFTIRVVVFAAYVLLGLALNGSAIKNWTNPVPDLCLSTFGIVVFLVFGSQRDILVTWRSALTHCISSGSTFCLYIARKLGAFHRQPPSTLQIDIIVDVETATQTSRGSFATLTPYPYHLRSADPAVSKVPLAITTRYTAFDMPPPVLPSPSAASSATLWSDQRSPA